MAARPSRLALAALGSALGDSLVEEQRVVLLGPLHEPVHPHLDVGLGGQLLRVVGLLGEDCDFVTVSVGLCVSVGACNSFIFSDWRA